MHSLFSGYVAWNIFYLMVIVHRTNLLRLIWHLQACITNKFRHFHLCKVESGRLTGSLLNFFRKKPISAGLCILDLKNSNLMPRTANGSMENLHIKFCPTSPLRISGCQIIRPRFEWCPMRYIACWKSAGQYCNYPFWQTLVIQNRMTFSKYLQKS